MIRTTRNLGAAQRGGALLLSIITLVSIAGLAAALLAVVGSRQKENGADVEQAKARYLAEAGLSAAITAVRTGAPAALGSQGGPIAFGGGGYWTTAVDNLDGTLTLESFGTRNGRSVGLEAVLVGQTEGVYTSALFAGNSSGDPLYDLSFGGTGASADLVDGNVYSGGNVVVKGDASISGDIRAAGTISGESGTTSKPLPIPDIAGMKYEANHDFDVAALFSTAVYSSVGPCGGKAWQLPADNPAHIFRKNPSDRASNTSATAKDDYFLEDPHGTISSSKQVDAGYASQIYLSGVGGKPGPNGNDAVYYIDGNLWIHNLTAYSFSFANPKGASPRITIVVRGNVYISDNILYHDETKDGLALIAIKDDSVKDSGNIYFGDPTFGTLEEMNAFMYAENDFYDTNLSASGSATVKVLGNMTAGNQVKINRDFAGAHSKLTVEFDERLMTEDLTLPGLPSSGAGATTTWTVASWREIAAQ
ncbi:MAG: hypothetical protein L6Q99_21140 [Planctomycetes bacterium]|nr:hypothetical protein [Planctomycetota bacterium]